MKKEKQKKWQVFNPTGPRALRVARAASGTTTIIVVVLWAKKTPWRWWVAWRGGVALLVVRNREPHDQYSSFTVSFHRDWSKIFLLGVLLVGARRPPALRMHFLAASWFRILPFLFFSFPFSFLFSFFFLELLNHVCFAVMAYLFVFLLFAVRRSNEYFYLLSKRTVGWILHCMCVYTHIFFYLAESENSAQTWNLHPATYYFFCSPIIFKLHCFSN